ncbi:MAG: polysaccharide pyruvyl transferase family protein [Acidobacteriota bacterium]|nr:polysaccharide pyruvyl transferase family protein [Acidobacteriota bacterium]
MSRRWHLVGAFDRFNYGDLLFPHLVERSLERLGVAVELRCWSTRAADLSAHGGKVCGSLRQLQASEARSGDAVVVAGGEVLAARWTGTLRGLVSPRPSLALGLARRVLGAATTDFLARQWLHGRTPQPWLLGPEDVGGAMVAYNAVGAQGVTSLPPALARPAQERLAQARHLAVRDRGSREALESWGLAPALAPDSAALVAELFPRGWLEEQLSPPTTDLLQRRGEGFLVFQTGRFPLRRRLSTVADQLRQLVDATGRPLVLLPLGLASAHEDPHALAQLAATLGSAAELAPVRTIWDQMAILAAAGLYAGTSLHGALTATAFEVPVVGVGSRVSKLEAFLEDWYLGAGPESRSPACAPPEDLCPAALDALEEAEEVRIGRSRRLAKAAWEQARALAAALGA